MGSKSAGPGGQMGNLGGLGQGGGDVPAFDMPPTRTYTPEEWSATFGPNVTPDPLVIRQGPQTSGPMPPMPPAPYNPYNMTTSADMNRQAPPIPGGQGDQQAAPRLGGQGPAPAMSNDDYLRQLYEDELGRAADQSGMDFWLQQMSNGMGRDQVRQWFDQSEEGQGYNQRLRPMIDDFSRPPPGTPYPPRAPIERPMMPPEVVDALRLAMQGQQPPPMGQTPMPIPQQRGVPHPAAQSDAPQIARALRIMRGLPVY